MQISQPYGDTIALIIRASRIARVAAVSAAVVRPAESIAIAHRHAGGTRLAIGSRWIAAQVNTCDVIALGGKAVDDIV